MLPLKDDIRVSSRPIITYVILGINIVVFLYEMALGPALRDFVIQFGATPFYIFHPTGFSSYATLFSSMFIHANIMHIFGNMLFLWIFADNIEDRLGRIKFIFFYLLCGLGGALLHSVTAPNSTVPMIGASGAISGVLGAYILLYPKARILALIPFGFFLRITYLPSIIFLGIWFLYQFLFGISSVSGRGGVAYFAHIGGFIVGLLLALPFKFKNRKPNYEYKIL
jgi:membrane associated rhomboid family serine protease